jgi:hypothetical protein
MIVLNLLFSAAKLDDKVDQLENGQLNEESSNTAESALEERPLDPQHSDIVMPIMNETALYETLISVTLSTLSAINSPDGFVESGFINDVNLCMQRRRDKLSPTQKFWMQHLSGENIIDITQLKESLHEIYESDYVEVQHLGTILTAAIEVISWIDSRVREREVFFIRQLKANDPRWEEAFNQFKLRVGKDTFAGGNLSLAMDDHICTIGDIIDDRHMRWLQISKKLYEDSQYDVDIFVDLFNEYNFSNMKILSKPKFL